jgi:hypothetical protein
LQHGDVITIGHHQLRFADEQASETEQDEFEKTMVIPSSQQNPAHLAMAEAAADVAVEAAASSETADDAVEAVSGQAAGVAQVAAAVMLDPEEAAALEDDMQKDEVAAEPVAAEPVAAEPVADKPVVSEPPAVEHARTTVGIDPGTAPNALPLAKLQVLSGAFAGRELELTKALTTLGRPGIQVAAITRRAEGYFIVHVESGEKDDFPLVNGQAIGAQARKLADNDVVQLAGVKMGFFAD